MTQNKDDNPKGSLSDREFADFVISAYQNQKEASEFRSKNWEAIQQKLNSRESKQLSHKGRSALIGSAAAIAIAASLSLLFWNQTRTDHDTLTGIKSNQSWLPVRITTKQTNDLYLFEIETSDAGYIRMLKNQNDSLEWIGETTRTTRASSFLFEKDNAYFGYQKQAGQIASFCVYASKELKDIEQLEATRELFARLKGMGQCVDL